MALYPFIRDGIVRVPDEHVVDVLDQYGAAYPIVAREITQDGNGRGAVDGELEREQSGFLPQHIEIDVELHSRGTDKDEGVGPGLRRTFPPRRPEFRRIKGGRPIATDPQADFQGRGGDKGRRDRPSRHLQPAARWNRSVVLKIGNK